MKSRRAYDMRINPEWTFSEIVENLERLKKEYLFSLAFFSYYHNDLRIINAYKKTTRDQFYTLQIKEWQIEMCWEYMNDDMILQQVRAVARKIDKKVDK